ncbi:MAG TPA: polysaccharide biosynthesis/export family protein [Pyrinomonadaceae bacterium]|jgi:polysaccharide export outer membrane protein|nr:polysaccharide biosynthesis/export family protein [Pyrinomonadaceae bacterium]
MVFTKRIVIIALLAASVGLAVPAFGQSQTRSRQAAPAPTLGTFGNEERYLLHPGDVLDIQYRYTPEFNQTVTVQPDGFISLEIGGDVKVSGRNLEQVRNVILTKARTRLATPELIVVLKEFQKPYVVVAGEVAQPGKLEMREQLTALQAVLLAGGFKDSAKSSQILVFRKLNADTAEVKILNFKSLKQTSDLENDLTLRPGDMILVPRNRLSKIERYVRIASLATFLNPLIP